MALHFSFTRSVNAGLLILILLPVAAAAQDKKAYKIAGTVYESKVTKGKPLPYAAVSIPAYGITAQTDAYGRFELANVPSGAANLHVRFLGKVTIDTLLQINNNMDLNFTLRNSDFRLTEVSVTAKSSSGSNGTASRISRAAIDHLQANSLADVMALLPGGVTTNPDLTNAKTITIRNAYSGNNPVDAMNAFGTSILMNGAPMTNNANLQTLSPTVNGGTGALGGGASPSNGFDVRGISMNNIESVEVIRGVPGVEYGDVTAGVVIVNTKAGEQPLSIQARTNPNVYQLSANKGFNLGERSGALNLGVDYSYNTNDPVQQYLKYQRFTGRAMYSNTFFHRLSSTTSLDLIYGKDTRNQNPDDQVTKTRSSGQDVGLIFNTRGALKFNDSWLRTLNYVARVGYTARNSYYETQYTSAIAPYSMTTNDGSILTNRPGTDIYDNNGNKLTTANPGDQGKYAVYLPSTYMGANNINGKEFNSFFKVAATFFNKIGATNHRWILGADFKTDKNYGDGKTFSDTAPPLRSNASLNATFRPRAYRDIPALNQLGLYAEENFNTRIAGRRLDLTAGLRYDQFSGNRNALSPRLNGNLEIIPRVLSINGAYGKLAKAPSTLYLYPEQAYFEYVNINEIGKAGIPADQQVLMTTTRVFNTENKDLEIAKNEKAEVGIRLNVSQATLRLTGYQEKMNSGYTLGHSVNGYQPVTWNEYTRVGDGSQPIYQLAASNPVLAGYFMPTNNLVAKTRGLEMDLDLGRFKSIRTAFVLNGAILRTESYNKDYTYFDDFSTNAAASRTHIGLYQPGMLHRYDQSAVTSLRATHNIPKLGFVVTLTTQVIWTESNWTEYGNDSIPVKYISKNDGQVYDFDPARKDEPEFKSLIRNTNRNAYTKESYPPLLTFNVNITKEIADYMRVSFLANNMFRTYQRAESDRSPGTYVQRGNKFFFGLELSLTL
ncbi:carboxypeptidase-like regulatory domain-containing protein [Chitinophaga sp. sic0106]|uniref:TonB-dependent receptor n=1 Tax=Chitinophaga sp. sic0106 TaxID=2854785 RepID=UPI001C475FF3|nr:carboxypeptidase-like regulatory domain-containing protein [Chitinophaga sp. sic0106]MBV7533076.1 TonB-dependent receptor [Chitinophaga sp. sic0106]